MNHFREVCPEGEVVRSCRCPGGTLVIVPCPPEHDHTTKDETDGEPASDKDS